MADPIVKALSSNQTTGESRCTKPFLLCELQEGKSDKLGHIVEDILWMGRNYAISHGKRCVSALLGCPCGGGRPAEQIYRYLS